MVEKKKRPVVHEIAIKLLKEEPKTYFWPLVKLYEYGTVVPRKDIPELIKAFREAGKKLGYHVEDTIDEFICNCLKEQLEETKETEKKNQTE